MNELADIIPGMLAMLAGIEVLLMVFKATLLRAGQAQSLESQIEELKEEFKTAQERNREREIELKAANVVTADAQAALRRASTELAESQQSRDVLVHRLGEPPGELYRASLTKTLPSPSEENQVLIWSCPHLVEVWAIEPEHALELATRNFTEKAGYALGPFQVLASTPPPGTGEAGAGG